MHESLSGEKLVGTDEIFINYLMAPDKMNMNMHMLMGMYGISDYVTFMFMMNYVQNNMNMQMLGSSLGQHQHGNSHESSHLMYSSGLSDLKLNALFNLLNNEKHQLILSPGVSLPIGSIDVLSDNNSMSTSQRLPYAMQLGSGTYDLIPAFSYLWKSEKVQLGSQINATYRLSKNNNNYRLGNELNFSAWSAYPWTDNISSSLRLQASISDKITGFDKMLYLYDEPASNPKNYGGKICNAFLGSAYNFSAGYFQNNRFALEFGFPLYQYTNGIQMASKFNINASWSMMF